MKPSFDPSVSTSPEGDQVASRPSGDVPAGKTPPRHAVESLPPALSLLRNSPGPSGPASRPSSFRVPGSVQAPVVLAPIPRHAEPVASLDLKRPANPAHDSSPFRVPREPAPASEQASAWGRMANRAGHGAQWQETRNPWGALRNPPGPSSPASRPSSFRVPGSVQAPVVLAPIPRHAAPDASLDLKRPANPAHDSSPFRVPKEPAPASEQASAWGRMANRAGHGAQWQGTRNPRDEIRRRLESKMDKPRNPEYLAGPHAVAESREVIRKRKESEMETPRTPQYPSVFPASGHPVSAPPPSEPPATSPPIRWRTNPETGEKVEWKPINSAEDDVDEHVKAHALRLRERITGRADSRELDVNNPLDARCLDAALQGTEVVDLRGIEGHDRTARRTPDAH
ncbi:hypothetical protein BLA23254_06791 [Burkholderia lata]|uniref:Uncharacterized protein n=1 Tax=Burkholderia lata (strain ATCC 17760 / DSM 23089 / LMG 22485 / NCIMB 9086 / R18194 / 383) TaxID=482957 RepID=A0A6P2RN82_BURL3|nr:hypothetical protein BLA23254_06791 [Burkholderia lata]